MYKEFADESIGRRFNILFRLSMAYFRNEMKKLGFGAGDYPFIALLFLNEGLSQDELSRLMRVDKSYTARALAKLEKMEMVERRPDPEEHRAKRVYLGKKILANEKKFFHILENWQATLINEIDEDHVEIVRNSLDKMVTNAEVFLGLEDNQNQVIRKII